MRNKLFISTVLFMLFFNINTNATNASTQEDEKDVCISQATNGLLNISSGIGETQTKSIELGEFLIEVNNEGKVVIKPKNMDATTKSSERYLKFNHQNYIGIPYPNCEETHQFRPSGDGLFIIGNITIGCDLLIQCPGVFTLSEGQCLIDNCPTDSFEWAN
ncbi:MAG: hypothetical protein ACK5LR_06825 [Mangrovibacterium sp.]